MKSIPLSILKKYCIGSLSLLCLTGAASPGLAQQIMFDDFSYSNTTQLTNNGWRVRTWSGGPGLANGSWSASNVTQPLRAINSCA